MELSEAETEGGGGGDNIEKLTLTCPLFHSNVPEGEKAPCGLSHKNHLSTHHCADDLALFLPVEMNVIG